MAGRGACIVGTMRPPGTTTGMWCGRALAALAAGAGGVRAWLDAAAAAAALETARVGDFDGPAHTFTDSAARTFTTAP